MTYEIVAGTTDVLTFQLVENGVPIDLGSIVVSLLLEDRNGNPVGDPLYIGGPGPPVIGSYDVGTVTVTDASMGKVQLTPLNATLFVAANGPYYARWKLVNVNFQFFYVPSTGRDVWNIFGV